MRKLGGYKGRPSPMALMFLLSGNTTEKLKKTELGRIKLLERMINYGPEPNEKIKISDVKKYWEKLQLFPKRKRLLELLIWGKIQSSQKIKPLF